MVYGGGDTHTVLGSLFTNSNIRMAEKITILN